jgi:hypothetical protein
MAGVTSDLLLYPKFGKMKSHDLYYLPECASLVTVSGSKHVVQGTLSWYAES